MEQVLSFKKVFEKLPLDCQEEVMKQRDALLEGESLVVKATLNGLGRDRVPPQVVHTVCFERSGTEYEPVIVWERETDLQSAVGKKACHKFHDAQKEMIIEDIVNDIIERSEDLVSDTFYLVAGKRKVVVGGSELEDYLLSYSFRADEYFDYVGVENAHKIYKKLAGEMHMALGRLFEYLEYHKL